MGSLIIIIVNSRSCCSVNERDESSLFLLSIFFAIHWLFWFRVAWLRVFALFRDSFPKFSSLFGSGPFHLIFLFPLVLIKS